MNDATRAFTDNATPDARPNVVYVLADDMGYGDVSCFNPDSRIRTRRLDELAAGGMAFTDGHASSAVCTPSRYSILTGRYNFRSALKQGVLWGYSTPLIEPGRATVASMLREHGYHTGCIGKWHLGWDWAGGTEPDAVDFTKPIERGPTTVGFDRFFGIAASLDMPPYVYVSQDMPTAAPDRIVPGRTGKELFREGPIAPDFEPEDVLPRLTREALAYVDERAADGKPFFLYFPLPAPHTPILPTPEFQGKSGTNAYGDFCLQVDDVVGQLMDRLQQHGLADNTIVIFTADNGCSPQADFDELAAVGHHPSYVFRGHKADIYEGGHRVPLIVRWPRRIPGGATCDQTVCLTDLYATMAAIVGDDIPPDAAEDSVSNLPAWLGEPLAIGPDAQALREATVHTSVDGSLSIRQGRWKLEMCPGSGGWSDPKPGPACDGLPPVQLYDLNADVGERRNLQAEHPDVVAELRDLLTSYIRRGRSTPGPEQPNWGGADWSQLWWMRHPSSAG